MTVAGNALSAPSTEYGSSDAGSLLPIHENSPFKSSWAPHSKSATSEQNHNSPMNTSSGIALAEQRIRRKSGSVFPPNVPPSEPDKPSTDPPQALTSQPLKRALDDELQDNISIVPSHVSDAASLDTYSYQPTSSEDDWRTLFPGLTTEQTAFEQMWETYVVPDTPISDASENVATVLE